MIDQPLGLCVADSASLTPTWLGSEIHGSEVIVPRHGMTRSYQRRRPKYMHELVGWNLFDVVAGLLKDSVGLET